MHRQDIWTQDIPGILFLYYHQQVTLSGKSEEEIEKKEINAIFVFPRNSSVSIYLN